MKTVQQAALALALWVAIPGLSAAQRAVDIERFRPALDADGFLAVQGTRTPGNLRTSFGAFLQYGHGLLAVERADGTEVDAVSDRLAASLSAQLGLWARAALAVSVPFVAYQAGDPIDTRDPDLQSAALADPALHARYRLLGDVGERNDGPGLALQVSMFAPLGSTSAFAGENAVRGEAQLLADFHAFGFGGGLSLGVRHAFGERELFGSEVRDEFTFGAAVRMPIPPLHPLAALVEVRGGTDFQSAATTGVEGELAGFLGFHEITIALSVGAGFTGGYGVPNVRAIAGLWYAPKESDTDKDGIDDDQDRCPPLPEDRDQFDDGDGCPDPDNDNDLVPDADDLCPNEEALEGQDDDEDGCTDPG
jgi:OmpA-OmpF porin, OOP family